MVLTWVALSSVPTRPDALKLLPVALTAWASAPPAGAATAANADA